MALTAQAGGAPAVALPAKVSDWKGVVTIAAQLALAMLVVRQFQLESNVFFRVLLVAGAGFVVHALLPLKHRLSFFVGLSFVALGAALGIRDALWLSAAGLSLIAVCHIPIRFGYRVLLVLLLGAAHAVARAGLVEVPWSGAVWPILGSMFMFRMALYLYALRHDPLPPTWQRSIAYFFMLPNMAYPLFPVVDYSTFSRVHYDAEANGIYQRGMVWIARGLLHLLLYRFVYLHLTLPGSEIRDAGDLVRSMLATFLLYLRVSGQFHVAVGILHLFGFHLPETHKLYYLASSFTDFWRRINIYWKDFMMKLVYYPSFFKLRRYGDRVALVIATAIVFGSTWILHSYQWFWLQGGFPLTLPDGLFWGILGVFVIFATLREMKRGRKRSLSKPKSFDVGRGLRTTMMFVFLTVLWSLWSTESVVEWLWQWSAIAHADALDIALIVTGVVLFFLIAARSWDTPVTVNPADRPLLLRPAARTFGMLLGLMLLGQPALYDQGGPRVASFMGSLRSNDLSASDRERQFLGYYERLDNEGQLADVATARAETAAPTGSDWAPFFNSEARRARDDFMVHDIAPDRTVRFKGAELSTNRWGMRDRDYTQEKPAGTIRIALLGPSITMGTGVRDEEVFEAILEEQLNALGPSGLRKYEILNFGVAGHSLLQQMALLEDRVFGFDPDIVIITTPGIDHMQMHLLSHLNGEVLERGLPVPYPDLKAMLAAQGIREWGGAGFEVPYPSLRALAGAVGLDVVMPVVERRSRLDPILDDIVGWSVRRMGDTIRAHGAVPVFLAMDDVSAPDADEVPAQSIALESGFVVINLLDLYQGQDITALRIAPWDDHPNARANRMIADRLLLELRKNDAALNLGLSTRQASNDNPAAE